MTIKFFNCMYSKNSMGKGHLFTLDPLVSNCGFYATTEITKEILLKIPGNTEKNKAIINIIIIKQLLPLKMKCR